MSIRKKTILISGLIVLVLGLGIIGCQGDNDTSQNQDGMLIEQQGAEEYGITFPYELEDGKLIITSIFQSTIENPDANNAIGEDVASIELINQSEEFCEEAEIRLIMQDNSVYTFKIFDLPAGKTIWAFDINNQILLQDEIYAEIESKALFGSYDMLEQEVSCTVDDTVIYVHNMTDEHIENLMVYSHCLFEDVYFGGRCYGYQIEQLQPGSEVTIEADDCYMGNAEIVKIEKTN